MTTFFERRCEADEVAQAVEAAGGEVSSITERKIGWSVGISKLPDVGAFVRTYNHLNPHRIVAYDYSGFVFSERSQEAA